MRVLVVDESAKRAEVLRAALLLAGYEVTASLTSALTLLKTIERLEPAVILIDTDSPSRDVLEHLVMVSRHTPRPVVMFASDGTPETIRAATRAGVSAYVRYSCRRRRSRTCPEARCFSPCTGAGVSLEGRGSTRSPSARWIRCRASPSSSIAPCASSPPRCLGAWLHGPLQMILRSSCSSSSR
jgi:CheY-like chemotaxis protein